MLLAADDDEDDDIEGRVVRPERAPEEEEDVDGEGSEYGVTVDGREMLSWLKTVPVASNPSPIVTEDTEDATEVAAPVLARLPAGAAARGSMLTVCGGTKSPINWTSRSLT